MPTYEYRCGACGHEFEEFQSMTAPRLKKCPACKKPALERLIGTGAAVVFKGSGFYQTDYRSESYREAAKKDAEPPKADASSEAKADVRPQPDSAKPAEPRTAGSKPVESKPAEARSTRSKATKVAGTKKSKGTAP